MIQYIKRLDLDIEKYNACIENSLQSRSYAFSWYLDIVADNWDALILNDYEAVMPITWKQKYFIKYVTQPYFCQQLGVFSEKEISHQLLQGFADKIPAIFLKIGYQFNSENNFQNLGFKKKTNYILKLETAYTELRKAYRKDRKYRVNQVKKKNYEIVSTDSNELLSITQKHYSFIKVSKEGYRRLELLMQTSIKNNSGFIRSVLDVNGKVLGGCFFLKSKNRIVYLFSVMTPEGKKEQIPSLIIDTIIKEFSNTNYTLDFEGSMISSVASFYKSFGAITENYHVLEKKLFSFF